MGTRVMGIYKYPADNNDLVDNNDDVELDYLGFYINYVNRLAKNPGHLSTEKAGKKKNLHMPSFALLLSSFALFSIQEVGSC